MIALGGKHHAGKGEASLAGDLLVVLSLGIALFWILLNKKLMAKHSHIVVTAYGVLLGTLILGEPLSPRLAVAGAIVLAGMTLVRGK